jgi:formylglycine-generating enzyme required for sulfatase activity
MTLFYFAGRILQQKDRKLLLPVDAAVEPADNQAIRAVAMDQVVDAMQQTRRGGAKLVVLDAAAYAPAAKYRGLRVGSAAASPGSGFFLADSNGLTETAGGLSVFTKELLAALNAPERPVERLFQSVKVAVNGAGGAPEPTHSSTLTHDVYLVNPEGGVRAGRSAEVEEGSQVVRRGIRLSDQEAPQARLDNPPARGSETAQASGPSSEFETALWNVIQESKNPADFEAYLEVFPSGQYAAQARQRIAVLRAPAAPNPAPKAPPAAPKIEALQGDYELIVPANIRKSPDIGAPVLARAEKGTRLEVTGRVAGANWYQVKTARGETAYVASNLLREAPKAAPPKPQVAVAPPRLPSSPPSTGSGDSFRDCPNCPEMVRLPAGTYRMGNDKGDISERPAHSVRIAQPFAIGKYEVTIAEWKACADAGGCSYTPRIKGAPDSSPVHKLSWKDIQEYLAWLKKTTGKAYRLPSEAEWEYAARGGTGSRFWWGERMAAGMADCKDCGGSWNYGFPAPANSSKPNPFGLYGMSGGVWEWTDDCWRADHDNAPSDGKASSKGDCGARALRGGAWRNDQGYVHMSSRLRYDFNVRYSTNGFRVVRDLP